MNPPNFNDKSNPMIPYFRQTVLEYLDAGEMISHMEEEAIGQLAKRDELAPEVFQDGLEDLRHHMIDTMDNYLNALNYMKLLGQFERLKLLRAVKGDLDAYNLPALKVFETDEAIDTEIREAIDCVFEALVIVQSAFSEKTKAALFNVQKHTNAFANARGSVERFLEKDDMDERMEYNFLLAYSRRLDFYDISKQMRDNLDMLQNDPVERRECIKARLVGIEQERFPPQMCTLDGYTDEEIEIAKKELQQEEKERQEAAERAKKVVELDERTGEEVDSDDIAELWEKPLRDPKKAEQADKNPQESKTAEVIPIDRFRKKREP